MKLSNQAVGAIMMALQKSLMEQSDIVPTLQGMSFVTMDNGELLVENPPIVKAATKEVNEVDDTNEVYTTRTTFNKTTKNA
tara:strand:- start:40 stop:282 length:243 start_codon:yes stop_codon:yes gene_type:complete